MTDVIEQLLELGTLEACSARVPTAQEHDREAVEPWVEVVLDLQRDNKVLRLNLRRHDAEVIIEVLHRVLRPHTGMSIQQGMWADLDDVYASIKAGDKSSLTRGMALGIARCLARLRSTSVDAIRAEARDRWRGAKRANRRANVTER